MQSACESQSEAFQADPQLAHILGLKDLAVQRADSDRTVVHLLRGLEGESESVLISPDSRAQPLPLGLAILERADALRIGRDAHRHR